MFRPMRWLVVLLGSVLTGVALTGAFPVSIAGGIDAASAPDFRSDGMLSGADGDDMPRAATEGLALLERSELLRPIQAYEWDSRRGVLLLHVPSGEPVDVGAVATILAETKWQIVEDRFSAERLRSAADQVARAQRINGVNVSWAGAKIDGSGLRVALLSESGAVDEKAVRARIASIVGDAFPVDISYESRSALLADRQYRTQPFIGGALISTRNGGYLSTCSSGFSVVQDGVPTSRTAMLTADHCGTAGTEWKSGKYTDSPYYGTGQATSAGGADIRMLTGDVLFYGANFVGSPTSNSAVWMKGYSVPLVGQSVCMNGSQSGTVCSNTITDGPVSLNAADASGTNHTYANSYRSVQIFNQPAAGNGDSGGPVLRVVDNKPYATGIISAIQDGANDCTGNPSTPSRKCSAVVWTAGLNAFLGSNLSWRVLTG